MGRADADIVMFAGERPLLHTRPGGALSAVFPRDMADQMAQPAQNVVLLGLDEGGRPALARHYPALDHDPGDSDPPPPPKPATMVRDLRSLAVEGALPGFQLSLLALAKSLLSWHLSHRYCSRCGTATVSAFGGYRRDCSACDFQHFPRTDPVVIMLVTHQCRALLASSPHFPPGMFSAIAGFVEPGETIEEAVRRETAEETGLAVGAVRYSMSQPWPFASSLMIGCYAQAQSDRLALNPAELAAAHWLTRAELRAALNGDGDIILPPPFAIAHHLVRDFIGSA